MRELSHNLSVVLSSRLKPDWIRKRTGSWRSDKMSWGESSTYGNIYFIISQNTSGVLLLPLHLILFPVPWLLQKFFASTVEWNAESAGFVWEERNSDGDWEPAFVNGCRGMSLLHKNKSITWLTFNMLSSKMYHPLFPERALTRRSETAVGGNVLCLPVLCFSLVLQIVQ